jgi:hypothetical protein
MHNSSGAPAGYWPSPWPGEDGGPTRSQAPHGLAGLDIKPGERLDVTSRDAWAITMVVLREPGEVFALRHSMGARTFQDPTVGWVERIDPESLEPLVRSPDLPAGPFWPGGVAAHANGSLHTVYGRWCHRLAPDCSVLAARELPRPRPYNSFVILADGTLATKEFDRECRHPAHLSLLDPDTLEPRCAEVELPEPVIARLSADGLMLYVVGVTTVFRYRWNPDAARLERDEEWSVLYRNSPDQSYGWDPVIEGGHLWFMDNGEHRYVTTMLGAGVAAGPVHLMRVSLKSTDDPEFIEICGEPHGTVTDPPLYDPKRRIALAYDSGNGVLGAWRLPDDGGPLELLWRKPCATASHMIRYPDTGEIAVGDFNNGLPALSGPRTQALATRSGRLLASRRLRAAGARRSHDDVVLLDIKTGEERARAPVPSLFQSVLFPAPGWNRDLYYVTLSTIARVSVA